MRNSFGVMENFEQEIAVIMDSPGQQLKMIHEGINLCNTVLSQLKEQVEKEDFKTVSDEIHFFKKVKPSVMSYLIYFSEVSSSEIRKPKAGTEFQIKFYAKELKKINKFFYRNSDFAHYMELGHTYLDHQLFTRYPENNTYYSPVINYYQVPGFSTSHDVLWAKIKAKHYFIRHIRKTLARLKKGTPSIYPATSHKGLSWTSSKTALIELIYALYSEGAINHGKADISTITASFEDLFDVKLDNTYKTFAEIKARKGSKTKFLEELMFHLEQKIKRDDSF